MEALTAHPIQSITTNTTISIPVENTTRTAATTRTALRRKMTMSADEAEEEEEEDVERWWRCTPRSASR